MGSVIEEDFTPVEGAASQIEPFPDAPPQFKRGIAALVIIAISLLLVAGALVVGRLY